MSSTTHFNGPGGSDQGPISSWTTIVTGFMIVPALILLGLMLAPQNTLFDVKPVPANDARLKRSRSASRSAGPESEKARARSKSVKRATALTFTSANRDSPNVTDPLQSLQSGDQATARKRNSSKKLRQRQRRATLSGALPLLEPGHIQALPLPQTSTKSLPPIPPLPYLPASPIPPLPLAAEATSTSARSKPDLQIVAPIPHQLIASPIVPILSPIPSPPLQRSAQPLAPHRALATANRPLAIDPRLRARPKSWHPPAFLPPPTPSTPVPSLASTPTRSLSPTTSVLSGVSPITWSGYANDPPVVPIDRVYQQLRDAQAHLRTLMDHSGATATWWAPRFSVIAPLHARARRVMYIARDLLPAIPAWARPSTPMGSSRASSMMASLDSTVPRDSLAMKGGDVAGDMHDPVVLALASTHEAQRIEVIHARARARARAQDKAADALAAVLEVVYPPGDYSEAVVVLRQYACSVEDQLRMKPPTGDEAKTVIMFVLAHVCMLAEIGVAFTEGFTLEHLLVKDSSRPLTMTNLVLSGYQNMQTVNGAVSVVDAATDHAAGMPMQQATQQALTRLFRRVEHFSDDLPLPIELDPEEDFKTLQSLYSAIARNDG